MVSKHSFSSKYLFWNQSIFSFLLFCFCFCTLKKILLFLVSEIRMRSVFIHVDVPGQHDDAKDLEHFPTIQQIGK